MRKTHHSSRSYTGSALLLSAVQRVVGALLVVGVIWLLSAWALDWL